MVIYVKMKNGEFIGLNICITMYVFDTYIPSKYIPSRNNDIGAMQKLQQFALCSIIRSWEINI